MAEAPTRSRYRATDDGDPTVFTTEGAIGLFGGLAIGLSSAVGFPFLGAAVGAAAGGFAGLLRTRNEFSKGKYVEEGSLFNLKAIAGLAVGAAIAGVLLPLTPIAGTMLTAAYATSIIGGLLVGAVAGKAEQDEEFKEAKTKFELQQLTAEHQIHKQQAADIERARDINLPEFEDGKAGAEFRRRIEAQRLENLKTLRR